MSCKNLLRHGAHAAHLRAWPVIVQVDSSAGNPTKRLQGFLEDRDLRLSACVAKFEAAQQHCDAAHLFMLLRAGHPAARKRRQGIR